MPPISSSIKKNNEIIIIKAKGGLNDPEVDTHKKI